MKIKSDDLLVLLAVERHRTFTAAAQQLEIDHTTVARRLQALAQAVGGRLLVEGPGGWELTQLGHEVTAAARGVEEALAAIDTTVSDSGSTLRGLVRVVAPEVFMTQVVAAAVAATCRANPRLLCELISVTRPTPVHGPSADLDIGVTRSRSRRVTTRHLLDYQLGLYASVEYLTQHGPVNNREELREHIPVYYVESMLQVEDLDRVDEFFPHRRGLLGATNVHAQLELVRASAGIGILPTYLADQHDLVPVLPEAATSTLTYWMTARPNNLRRPEVRAVADAISLHASTFGPESAT
ncbi:LysR family transcriptional regulator [Nocardioides gansuensis]|nr:LysR family transcriptional regulator [Nocardioides gansuensis]